MKPHGAHTTSYTVLSIHRRRASSLGQRQPLQQALESDRSATTHSLFPSQEQRSSVGSEGRGEVVQGLWNLRTWTFGTGVDIPAVSTNEFPFLHSPDGLW